MKIVNKQLKICLSRTDFFPCWKKKRFVSTENISWNQFTKSKNDTLWFHGIIPWNQLFLQLPIFKLYVCEFQLLITRKIFKLRGVNQFHVNLDDYSLPVLKNPIFRINVFQNYVPVWVYIHISVMGIGIMPT